MIAAMWFVEQGAAVCAPLFHTNRDYDLVVDRDGTLERVQVKTTRCHRRRRWEVTLCTGAETAAGAG